MSYFAPVNADGCPFCCALICQSTPTPTPQFDGQGRQIFVRDQGRFLLVVEGMNGPHGAPDAQGSYANTSTGTTFIPISSGTGRPSLQILSNRPLGNGSTAICDTGPAPDIGGVPAANPFPSDFAPNDAQITNTLEDFACRFVSSINPMEACTKDTFGLFSFIGSGSSRQFCFQVPQAAAFPTGDTLLAVQLRDASGGIGPKREIIIRVGP